MAEEQPTSGRSSSATSVSSASDGTSEISRDPAPKRRNFSVSETGSPSEVEARLQERKEEREQLLQRIRVLEEEQQRDLALCSQLQAGVTTGDGDKEARPQEEQCSPPEATSMCPPVNGAPPSEMECSRPCSESNSETPGSHSGAKARGARPHATFWVEPYLVRQLIGVRGERIIELERIFEAYGAKVSIDGSGSGVVLASTEQGAEDCDSAIIAKAQFLHEIARRRRIPLPEEPMRNSWWDVTTPDYQVSDRGAIGRPRTNTSANPSEAAGYFGKQGRY